MIEIIGNKDYTVFYKCDCGVGGKCMIKPLSSEGVIITTITCPICRTNERVRLMQYEKNREEVDSTKFAWAVVTYNEVTDYELRDEL